MVHKLEKLSAAEKLSSIRTTYLEHPQRYIALQAEPSQTTMSNPRKSRVGVDLDHLSSLQRGIALVFGILIVAPFYLASVSH